MTFIQEKINYNFSSKTKRSNPSDFINGRVLSLAGVGPMGWKKQKGADGRINEELLAAGCCSFKARPRMQWGE
jgi:hypothetical protein